MIKTHRALQIKKARCKVGLVNSDELTKILSKNYKHPRIGWQGVDPLGDTPNLIIKLTQLA